MVQMMTQAYQKMSRRKQADALGKKQYAATIDDGLLSGFIHHPDAFPLTYKKLWSYKDIYRDICRDLLPKKDDYQAEEANIGLCFRSQKYLKPGSIVEISIPLRGEIQKFQGKVVLVRSMDDHFEIGMWLLQAEDVHRARLVEQICHIETYLKTKKHKEGPFVSSERVAEEWVNKYAAAFPSAG